MGELKVVSKAELKVKLELHLKWLKDKKGGERADLSEANLSRADLSEANLSRADLSWADLSWADLSEADLSRADLRAANLSRADLRAANLSRADLSGADLSEANLSRADLSGADLSWADLSGADLREANLSWANLDFSVWPLWCGSLEVGKIDDRLALQLLAHVARLPTEGLSPEVAALITGLPELAKNGFCKYRGEVKPL
jgi:hypothetical protein